MPETTPDAVKKFLLDEILLSPLAEFLPAEPFRLFLDQYAGIFFKDNELPLEELGKWMESEYSAPQGTIRLIFERLQAKGKKQGINLLLPGQKPTAAPAEVPAPTPSPAPRPAAPAVESAPTPPSAPPPASPKEAAATPPPAPASRFKPEQVILLNDRPALYQLPLSNKEKSLLIFFDGRHSLAQVSARTKMPAEDLGEFLEKYWDSGKFQIVTSGPGRGLSESAPPASPQPALQESYFPSDEIMPTYERKRPPPGQKASSVKTKSPDKTAAGPSLSSKEKLLMAAIGLVLVVAVGFSIYYVRSMVKGESIEIHTLNPADYAAILPLVKAEQTGKVFLGTVEMGKWGQLSREEKVNLCGKLFSQVKSATIVQVQLRAPSGEYLALVHREDRVSILR